MLDNPTEQFRDAIRSAGLPPPDAIEADGKLRRFSTNGKGGDDSGWYILYGDGLPAGKFGDWRTGLKQTWKADTGRKLSQEENAAHRARMQAAEKTRAAAEQQAKQLAAAKAEDVWKAASPAKTHPYLDRKSIKPHGAQIYQEALVIPMRAGNTLHSLQFINPDGSKRFLTGGRVKGCYHLIGDTNATRVLLFAEGFATGASLHEATGLPVAVAFNAGNLPDVAMFWRRRLPATPFLICADDDYRTEGNPGKTKAEDAARLVDGAVVSPVFKSRPEGATDFNDLHQAEGLDAVKAIIDETVETLISAKRYFPIEALSHFDSISNGEILAGGAEPVLPSETDDIDETAANPFPPAFERPGYVVLDDWAEHNGRKIRPGVWHCTLNEDKQGNVTLSEHWFCSPLHVDAVTSDEQSNNFGRLLRFKNTLGGWREWAMPMELLRGSGEELRGELLAMGVELDPFRARQLLPAYLQTQHPSRRVRCALQVGWCNGAFVLPDVVIGPDASAVIFQSGERGFDEFTRAGTLEGWKSEIAARAIGNPLLLLALSSGFAGPMLARCNAEGGGFHLFGQSSTGKTTATEAACSIWGGSNYRKSWRTTANGLEGVAALHNDCFLALDEIKESASRDVGAIVYAIGNGYGKQRASRTGAARAVVRWRCFVLSNGEMTIATHMETDGLKIKAGQSIRLIDIPVARRFGAWDELHGAHSGTAFSDAVQRATTHHHGHAGRAFLERLAHDNRDFCAQLEAFKALPLFATDDAEGQSRRAAARFALVGLAGELATEYGITGWQEGDAIRAAAEFFRLWRDSRGKGNEEPRQIAGQVAGFIERHGDGRFSDAAVLSDVPVRERAGWWRDTGEGREFLFTSEGMREALKGFDFRHALDVLQTLGAIPPPTSSGGRAKFFRVAGRAMKLYPVNPDKLFEVNDVA